MDLKKRHLISIGHLIRLNKHLPDWGILATFCVVFNKQISTITRRIHEGKPQWWQLKSKFDLFCWKITILLPGQPYQPTTTVLIQDKGTFIYFNSMSNYILPLERSLSMKCIKHNRTIRLLSCHNYSAFVNSCPLQTDTILLPLIHSHNVILSSNKF